MKTLIIAPHMDDESISCGGLIQARIAAGWEVYVTTVYGRRYSYDKPEEPEQLKSDNAEFFDFMEACKVLGVLEQRISAFFLSEGEPAQVGYYRVLKEVEEQIKQVQPDEIVLPSPDDLNQDHRFLHHIIGIALRPINLGRASRVLEFFALDGRLRQPTYYVPLSNMQMHVKLMAIAAYRREARSGTSPRAPENVMAQARVWGSCCGSTFAEAYRLSFARESYAGSDHWGLGLHRHQLNAASGQDRA